MASGEHVAWRSCTVHLFAQGYSTAHEITVNALCYYCTALHNIVQCCTLLYSTVHYCAVNTLGTTVPYCTVLCCPVQCNAKRSAAQHCTVDSCIVQPISCFRVVAARLHMGRYSAAQHNTVLHLSDNMCTKVKNYRTVTIWFQDAYCTAMQCSTSAAHTAQQRGIFAQLTCDVVL